VRTIQSKSGTQTTSAGFSLIEVMVSIVILTIGLLSVLSVFGLAVKATQSSQEDMIARQMASEAMESVYTARNTSQLAWAAIQNVANGGVFVDGPVAITCAGPDGIVGTADDTGCIPLTATGAACPGGVKCLSEPGPDGIVGTPDDLIVSLQGYTRQIQITGMSDAAGNPIPTLNSVTITIRYTAPNSAFPRSYILNEYVSSYH
jgi:prepilin-type N-terminal cleavage/methylation domain-containing protein